MSLDKWAVDRVTEVMSHIITMIKGPDETLELAMLTATVENEGVLYLLSGDVYKARGDKETTAKDYALDVIIAYGLNTQEPIKSIEDVASELLANCCFDLLNGIGKVSKRSMEIESEYPLEVQDQE